MTISTGSSAERIRSAIGRKARAAAWGAFLHAVVVGGARRGDAAVDELADRVGVGRSRVHQTLVGGAGFWLSDVAVLEEQHARAVLEMLAEVLGYRVSSLRAPDGALAAHVEVVQSCAAVISQATEAAADGRYTREEATPLRAALRRIRDAVDAIDQLLAEAEVHGVRRIA